jgi:hypothetical protein
MIADSPRKNLSLTGENPPARCGAIAFFDRFLTKKKKSRIL